jgi:hypothetical protein
MLQEKSKQNAKMPVLSQKCYSYISQKSQNQQSGANKKINQLNAAMWKKMTANSLKKN